MSRRERLIAAVVIAVGVLAIAAVLVVGNTMHDTEMPLAQTTTGTPASATPSATPVGSVVVSEDVPRSSNSRYAVSPPSVGAVSAVSAEQALKKAGLDPNPHLYVALIVLTDKVFRNANGPVIDHRLVWYVEEAHVPCISGSMGGCDHVEGAIVDATTGRRYFSFAGRPPGLKLPRPPGT